MSNTMIKAPIVITGGAQRIGLALVEALLEKEIPVVISYRTERPIIQSLQDRGVVCIAADFSSDAGILDFTRSVQSRYGQLRGIIHNASEWLADEPANNTRILQKMFSVHMSAPYQINVACQHLLLAYAEVHGSADIIHMSDYVASKGSKKHIAYAASKAGLENMSLSFAALLAPQIKVNTLSPSLLMFNDEDDEEYREKTLKKSLMRLCPGAQEAVHGVFYLLNSQYVTGHNLALDGGRRLN